MRKAIRVFMVGDLSDERFRRHMGKERYAIGKVYNGKQKLDKGFYAMDEKSDERKRMKSRI